MPVPATCIFRMPHAIDLHPIQGDLLRVLLFQPQARYTDLNPKRVPTDQFTFHLKRLVELGYVTKQSDGLYSLTATGKEFANRFDTDAPKLAIERQAKLGVSVGCVREVDGVTQYLVQERLKQPFFGYYGFVTGKVRWGEKVLETAARELEEETGLQADLTLVGVKHKMDYTADGNMLEDKFFFSVRGEHARGTLRETFDGGKNAWLTRHEIEKLPKIFHGMREGMDMLHSPTLVFDEATYKVEEY